MRVQIYEAIIRMEDYIFGLYVGVQVALNVIAILNMVSAPRLMVGDKLRNAPCGLGNDDALISVILPMRDEAKNVCGIMDDLLAQSYKNIEIIVVNDDSKDATRNLLGQYSRFENVRIIDKQILAGGWLGKNHAIWTGLQQAKGGVLLFLDADVRMRPTAVAEALELMLRNKAQALTCFPRQIMKSGGEKLTIPLMTWSHIGFIPLAFINESGQARNSLANGQFIMCEKDAYVKAGGHELIRASVSDDIDLIRNFKKAGAKVLVCLGNELVVCRMYSSYKEARIGFGRSLYRTIGDARIFLIYLALVISLFILPFIFVFFDIKWLIIIGMIMLHRVITSIIYRQNIFWNTLLHLPQMFVQIDLALYSLYLSKTNKAKWKGRIVS